MADTNTKSVTASAEHYATALPEGRNRPSGSVRGPYEWTLIALSVIFGLVSFWFVGTILFKSIPAFKQQGFYLLVGNAWNPTDGTTPSQYGALSMIIGTVETSLIAIVLAGVVGMGTSLAINFLLPARLRTFVATIVELLAAVPSVVYGIWGVLVLAPWVASTFGPWLTALPGGATIFGVSLAGKSLLLAGIVLAVMILPTFVAISREVIGAVPAELIEASLSLGATRWQTLWRTVIPTSRIGLFGATTLALGRAFGETIAVALVAGGVVQMNFHPLAQGTSLASFIAGQWGEAEGSDQVPALYALGVFLMLFSLAFSLIANRLVAKQRKAAAL